MWAASCVPRCDSRDSTMVGSNRVAAPDNMQIGSNQNQVVTINLSSRIAFDLKDVELCAKLRKGLTKCRQGFVVSTKTDEGEFAANSIVQCLAVVEPDVGQSRAGPCRRLVTIVDQCGRRLVIRAD